MILIDAGPLIALIDASDQMHRACKAAAAEIREELLTSEPALTEAVHVLGSRLGWRGQERLWTLVLTRRLLVEPLGEGGLARAAQLMAKYATASMDIGDASMVVLAERHHESRIFTVDREFLFYRMHDRVPFQMIPAPTGVAAKRRPAKARAAKRRRPRAD